MSRPTRRFIAAAAAAAVLVVALLVVLVAGVGGHRADVYLDDFSELTATLVAVAACAVASARQTGRGRIAWALMGASAFAWGVATLAWCWYELYLKVPVPFPGIPDIFYLASYPMAIAAVVTLPRSRLGASRTANGIDGMIVAGGLLTISWLGVMHLVYQASGTTALVQLVSTAYPAFDVVVASMLYMLLLRLPRGSRLSIGLLAMGLTCNAVADSVFAYLGATGSYSSGNPLDFGWVAGYLLIALGAYHAGQRPARRPAVTHLPSRWHLLFPYVPIAIALAAASQQVVTGGNLESTVFWLLGALVLLFVARQSLTLSANHTLMDHLSANEAQMRHQAFHDPLTGLANRSLFADRIDVALLGNPSGTSLVAILAIDLDDFKEVNDRLGHDAGDEVLVGVSHRLQASIRSGDTAVRLGGDEFAVVVGLVSNRSVAEQVARRVVLALNAPIDLASGRRPLRASVGLALAPAGTVGRAEVVRLADTAMYRAKAAGKGCLVVDDSLLQKRPLRVGRRADDLEQVAEGTSTELQWWPPRQPTGSSTPA